MTNSERASYIRGLMEGLELDPAAKETKGLNAMLELLDDLCVSVEELEDGFAELGEQVDEIDEDLGTLEEDYYGLNDEDECGCGDDDFFEVKCPTCGEDLVIDEDVLEAGTVECPHCKGKFVIDMGDCEDDDCGCGCGCDHDHDHDGEE